MTYFADVQAARDLVAQEQAQLAAAQSALSALLSQAVDGGPDLSQFNGTASFTSIAGAGYEVCFARVADGDTRDTVYLKARVDAIRAAGLLLSPYYFARVAAPGNGERDGRVEAGMAVWFAQSQGWGKTGDLPLAYDFESLNGQSADKAAKHVVQFINAYQFITQHPPIIYTNPATWGQVVDQLSAAQLTLVASCPLWIANWGVSAPTVPAPWTNWTFWQWTSTGSVPGVAGNVDLNRFAGSASDLAALRIP